MTYYLLALLTVSLVACEDVSRDAPESSEPFGGMGGTSGPMSSSGVLGCAGPDSCGPLQFCDMPAGTCNEAGDCKAAPPSCSTECPGACGCDGEHYCNVCVAWRAGTDIVPGEDCQPAPPVYRADLREGEQRRLYLSKRDVAWNRCTRITLVEGGVPSSLEVTVTAPWALESIIVTDQAVDCSAMAPDAEPVGLVIVPDGATGEIVIEGPEVPCDVGSDVSLELPAAVWLEGAESFETSPIQLAFCSPDMRGRGSP